jgi:hypothetical protein
MGAWPVRGRVDKIIRLLKEKKKSKKPNPKQYKPLTKGDLKKIEDMGYDIHQLKNEYGVSSGHDLFKDNKGNVIIMPKGGSGPGEPTGIKLR